VAALRDAGLVAGSRIVLEKPFGEDLDSAVALNRLLSEVVPEQAVFRVDHFLAMTTVQNVLGSRLANRVLEPIWNSAHIAEVEIVWNESLALEGRAGYYDGAGALKDMVQNHLLQVLCLVAMEPPLSLGERDLRDRKIDVLRSVRLLTDDDVVRRTRRARYLAASEIVTFPPTPRRRAWTRGAVPRPSPRSCWNSKAGAGPARPSGSAPARRSTMIAKRSLYASVPYRTCPSASTRKPRPTCCASGWRSRRA
jgi:hypothetical protein